MTDRTDGKEVRQLTEHLFRHQAAQIQASLVRILGVDHFELALDVVSDSLLKALETWPYRGIPDNPEAWLWRVARNRALDLLRMRAQSGAHQETVAEEVYRQAQSHLEPVRSRSPEEIEEDLLAMMFVCAHPALSQESRVALTLKVLCGFSVREIASAYLTSEATIGQRILRAKDSLLEARVRPELPDDSEISSRLDSVLMVLYLMFNEGYSAHSGPRLLRDELCRETIRMCELLGEKRETGEPRVHALLALMYFQYSRLNARTDEAGHIMLLSDQNRAKWDIESIRRGIRHLERSACGVEISMYHLEAGIAACHATASDYAHTDWKQIVNLYDQLVAKNQSPVIALNRAVAISMLHGPESGLKAVEQLALDPAFSRYHLYYATLAEFNMRQGNLEEAARFYERAISLAGNETERRFLEQKLALCRT